MKRKILHALLVSSFLLLAIVVVSFMVACAKPAPAPAPTPTPAPTPAPAPAPAPAPTPAPAPAPAAKPIELKLTSAFSTFNKSLSYVGVFVDMVNEQAKGELTIKWIGGPEVIPGFDQPAAASSGLIDIIILPSAWVAPLVPEAIVNSLSKLSLTEERESGFNDFMVEAYKKANLYYVGNAHFPSQLYLYTNVPVKTPWELAGHKMRSGGVFNEFLLSLDVAPVFMGPPEIYSAIERGLIDGYGAGHLTVTGLKLYEVTKYFIDHSFLSGDLVLVMSLDAWNRLPQHLQRLITDVKIEGEKVIPPIFTQLEAEATQKMLDNGMEPIKFSVEDAEAYREYAYKSKWEAVEKKVSPQSYAKLRELLVK